MNDILDEIKKEEEIKHLASTWTRFLSFGKDTAFFIIIYYLIPVYSSNSQTLPHFMTNIYFFLAARSIFYFLQEWALGRTLGYFFDKLKIVNDKLEKPNLKAYAIRALARTIPLGFITLYTPYKRSVTDILSKTWIVQK